MKKLNLVLAAIFVLSIVAFTFKNDEKKTSDNTTVAEGTYVVDASASTVKWTGEKIAYNHYGNVDISEGSLKFNASGLKGGMFTMDMTTITSTDIEDAEKNQKLVGHLKSGDFFDVEKHPKSTFKITSVKKENDGKYSVTGDLTIKGITHPLTFPASVKEKDGVVTAMANMTFDRSKYDVKFSSGSFFENLGDKIIYDDVKMEVSIVAKKDAGVASK